MVVNVPADAVVYVAGQKTSLTGTQRRFSIRTADASKTYRYGLRVETVRNGKTLVSETTHTIRAGQQISVNVAEAGSEELIVAAR